MNIINNDDGDGEVVDDGVKGLFLADHPEAIFRFIPIIVFINPIFKCFGYQPKASAGKY